MKKSESRIKFKKQLERVKNHKKDLKERGKRNRGC